MFRRFFDTMTEILSSLKADDPSFPHSGSRARILLAVSGGMDSMTMATLFAKLRDNSGGADIAIAHCNFHLRGGESDGDCALVREWAESHGIVCHVADFDTEAWAKEHCISIEMAARELRYSWFAELCRKESCDALAVAHNANDNAETLFLNLLRGTGVTGIAGMSALDSIPVEDCGIPMVRPLLQFTRNQIEGYAFAEKIPYRNDSTNAEVEYRRNRIRNIVFPVFEKINPSFIRTISREMGYFAQIKGIADSWFAEKSAGLMSEDAEGVHIDTKALMAMENWEYLLFRCIEPYGFNSAQAGHLEHLLKTSAAGTSVTRAGKHFRSAKYVLHTTGSGLLIVKDRAQDYSSEIRIESPGNYVFRGREICVERLEWKAGIPLKQPQGTMIFDEDLLGEELLLRGWKHGDRLRPLGMRGLKKVSDIFTDLKFTRPQKDSALILEATDPATGEKTVAAILGIRQDDRYKVSASTRSIWKISLS